MEKTTLLMVEDEADVLRVNQLHLSRQGYMIHTAQTLEEARRRLWENPPDLILLDVMLPDGSGLDFCGEIRQTSTAPIIMLTCLENVDLMVTALANGADDYITKPYNLNVLSARVSALLRRSGALRRGVIDFPPLSIDLRTGRGTMEGEDLILTQKELQLLAFFVENAGREFTSDEIYQHVWGEDATVPTNTVRVHISNLRNKLHLNQNAEFEIIRTPGKRYLFQRAAKHRKGAE
jgi:DNA-binding response OmpR family regulator